MKGIAWRNMFRKYQETCNDDEGHSHEHTWSDTQPNLASLAMAGHLWDRGMGLEFVANTWQCLGKEPDNDLKGTYMYPTEKTYAIL